MGYPTLCWNNSTGFTLQNLYNFVRVYMYMTGVNWQLIMSPCQRPDYRGWQCPGSSLRLTSLERVSVSDIHDIWQYFLTWTAGGWSYNPGILTPSHLMIKGLKPDQISQGFDRLLPTKILFFKWNRLNCSSSSGPVGFCIMKVASIVLYPNTWNNGYFDPLFWTGFLMIWI